MSQFVPKENGTPIRQPSTANLMIDSADRQKNPTTGATLGLANDFQISKTNSILNGFFTRVGTTELVLEWFQPNINPEAGNDTITATVGATPTVLTAVPGFYTQAQLLNWLAGELTILTAPTTWSIVLSTVDIPAAGGVAYLVPSAPTTITLTGPIATLLALDSPDVPPINNTDNPFFSGASDLRLYRYIDFVSSQLTYNQALKDASTAKIVRDVLARWYFAYDEPPALDEYGFPILMGYTPFVIRRSFSPPKQIRWESNLPIGNLSFQVYQPNGELAEMSNPTQWLMTLQVSEV